MSNNASWITVGGAQDLIADAGVGATVGNEQVAIFWLSASNQLFALSNFCPFSQANLLARGIIGDIQGEPVIASPLHKQHFSLLDGHCLEQPQIRLPLWQVRLHHQQLQLKRPD